MTELDRRAFLGFSTLATAGLLMDGWASPVGSQDIRGLPLTKDVATTAGRVRGVVRFGVNQFWGVPDAASTEGANRFMPPAAHAIASRWATALLRIPMDRSRRSLRSIGRSRWVRTASI